VLQAPLVTIFDHALNEPLLHEIGSGPQQVVTMVACPRFLQRELGWTLGGTRTPVVLPLTQSIDRMAREVVQNRLIGARHGTFIHARALDLLCTLASEWDAAAASYEAEALGLTPRDRERIQSLRDKLESMAHHPPSMSQLARLAGMNKTKLMRGFKQMFGETIADFCRRLRLEEARSMLLAERLTIGEIAAAVGYQHQSSFTAAFSAHYGFPPKTLLRAVPVGMAMRSRPELN
jgi:AraC-like DNA-binding protein